MQNATHEKMAEGNNPITTSVGHQQQIMHPLLMPSLVCNICSQKNIYQFID
jgi:hypothetical protein